VYRVRSHVLVIIKIVIATQTSSSQSRSSKTLKQSSSRMQIGNEATT